MQSFTKLIVLLWLLSVMSPAKASAEPYLADIQCFSFTFCPRGWAECAGQLLPINQNQALFALLGTTYGGDGRTNFALPNLQGRYAVQEGSGPGLSTRTMGETGGSESHTLTAAEVAGHTHTISAYPREADQTLSGDNVWAKSSDGSLIYTSNAPNVSMSAEALVQNGFATPQAVDIRQPYLPMKCCIALVGVFPSRP